MTTQSSNSYSVDPQTSQQFYINGRWSSPAIPASLPVVNPASEAVVAEVARGSAEDVDRAVAAARAAFAGWSATSANRARWSWERSTSSSLNAKRSCAGPLSGNGRCHRFRTGDASAAGGRTRSGRT